MKKSLPEQEIGMSLNLAKKKVQEYYDQDSKSYIKMYKKGYKQYPANLIRLKLIIERLQKNKVRTVLDAGCGSCGPMIKLLKKGFKVRGFDFSKEMVKKGKEQLKKANFDPQLIFQADLEKKATLPKGKFDAVIALGVFPHILDERKALLNIRKSLKKKGVVFISLRNDLFAAYTLNKYSFDFFLNKVVNLNSLSRAVAKNVTDFYSQRLKADKPKKKRKRKISYTDILAKFHNPLAIEKEFLKPAKFSLVQIHFYHYHALPPLFKNRYPRLFRKLSLKMEKSNDWRGYLMASSFVVEAKKDD